MKDSLLKFNLAALFAILILFNLVDAVTTAILVQHYGPNVEVNPILRELIEAYGTTALYGFKYFLISILGIILLALKTDRHIMVAKYTIWIPIACYGMVSIYNTLLVVSTINT